MKQTEFANKVTILAELYSTYKQDPDFKDFIEYNDLGLPLAFLAEDGLAEITETGIQYIEETWLLFLAALVIEDSQFESLKGLLEFVENKK
jgi:hypothetical protein